MNPCLPTNPVLLPLWVPSSPLYKRGVQGVENKCEYTCAKLLQSRPTLCHPVDYRPPGSSVHGILQARILEWVAIFSSRGSS